MCFGFHISSVLYIQYLIVSVGYVVALISAMYYVVLEEFLTSAQMI